MKKQRKKSDARGVKSAPRRPNKAHYRFPVVGIGASAGSFEAIEKFFTHLPVNPGIAFVIIMHLDPRHQGSISSVIQKYTSLPVSEAEDGTNVMPDHVYVIPPNKDMGIHNRKLLLLQPEKPRGARMPIDFFFQSLAEDQSNMAVGVIFSGMGSDGETGIRMIKEKLGMAMVQDPVSASYDSMPNSAISTNLVDYILPPEQLPVKLVQYVRHPAVNDSHGHYALPDARDDNAIQKILMMLRSQTGHDFSLYKRNTINRRIDRRIAFHQLTDYSKYANYLRENPVELNVLFNELLIGVTKFFRDQDAFETLKKHLFPLLDAKPEKEPVRVWVAGCSTGEEAYSIAILVMEYLEKRGSKKIPKVQVFATDLDGEAIEHARQGVYLENIVADVSAERISKYFIKQNNSFTVRKELREMIVFAQHNIIKDAPFTRLDLLSCRNLLIYLNVELQKKLIPIFHYSLNAKGLLLLGPAETLSGFADLFRSVEPKWKLFERKEGLTSQARIIDFPFSISHGTQPVKAGVWTKDKTTLQETFNRLLVENYTPASVLLNEKGDILYVSGNASDYFSLGAGEPVMNIHRMAREELKYAMSNAIHRVRTTNEVLVIKDIRLKNGKVLRKVSLRVVPLEDPPLQGLILVMFESPEIIKPGNRKKLKGKGQSNLAAEELEKELLFTKQQLHTTIEQMETSVEELKSTNEELQSTNEELQSTNEESLTTKEEMQSLNEELMTINMQYQSKAEELTQLNNDMKNLLDNTEIGTLFINNELEILRFTPQVNKLFHLLQTDIGRPITQVISKIQYPDAEKDIREVVDTLKAKEVELKALDKEWYNLRIMPYRTIDNFISGAVLTFHKITYLKTLETKAKISQKASNLLLEAISAPALLLDRELFVLFANSTFLKTFDLDEKKITNRSFKELRAAIMPGMKLDKVLKGAFKSDVHMVFRQKLPGRKNPVEINLTAKKLGNNESNSAEMIFLTFETNAREKTTQSSGKD
jgi:two-component system, chemotaxis family, CheB/CheR fusion protein